MARRRKRKPLPEEPIQVSIENFSHDGRGVAHYPDGKVVFVDGVLPGEDVSAKLTLVKNKFDEAKVVDVLKASDDRVEAPCEHALLCGGCSLQHVSPESQIALKQKTLREQFQHFGNTQPTTWLEPMTAGSLRYRRKARLGVKFVAKKESVLVGFREKRASFLAELNECHILSEHFDQLVPRLRQLFITMDAKDRIPQVEIAAGDEQSALIFRHLDPLSEADQQALSDFCQQHDYHCYLQPKGPDTVHKIWPDGEDRLHYRYDDFDITMAFHPQDFTQVNADINRRMVAQAVDFLELSKEDRVLDLFCGIGNFSLPLATKAQSVVAVEGVDAMVKRGEENAGLNQIDNVAFYATDLHKDFTQQPWAKAGFDKVLIDPPRSGAEEVCRFLPATGASKIVYISCNPATLARDAAILCEQGYQLDSAGVMDMFPHTTHVESIAVFNRI